MPDEDTKKETDSVLEAEGIIIENTTARDELEEDLNKLQTEDEERKLFEAIGVEMPSATVDIEEPTTDTVKEELNDRGIEVLPAEPLEEDGL